MTFEADYADQLEWWCIRAAQWMQEVIDDAQQATGRPDEETEQIDGRNLLSELDALIAGDDQRTTES